MFDLRLFFFAFHSTRALFSYPCPVNIQFLHHRSPIIFVLGYHYMKNVEIPVEVLMLTLPILCDKLPADRFHLVDRLFPSRTAKGERRKPMVRRYSREWKIRIRQAGGTPLTRLAASRSLPKPPSISQSLPSALQSFDQNLASVR